jgi:alpha-tubulin suppressor-like RCC1 family protein
MIARDKFKNMTVVNVVCSKNCSYFVCKNEINGTYHFFSAGEGLKGQLGQNLMKHMSDVEEMPDISGLVNSETMKPFEPLKMKCGWNHCLLLFKNPRVVYVWGNNEFGELGTKDRVFYESPVPMLEEYNLPHKILNISAGFDSSGFICEKIDKLKKGEIKEFERKEEEAQSLKRKKKKRKPAEPESASKENESSQFSLYNLYDKIKKYI